MIVDDLVAFPNLQSLQLKIGTSMPDECLQVSSSSAAFEYFVDHRLQPQTSLKVFLRYLSRLSNLQHLAFDTIRNLISSYYPYNLPHYGRRDAVELALVVQIKREAEEKAARMVMPVCKRLKTFRLGRSTWFDAERDGHGGVRWKRRPKKASKTAGTVAGLPGHFSV
jgi:hypothetical protein